MRNVLLAGSKFKNQVIPESKNLLVLSFLGVLFSAVMQFLLAFMLYWRLPAIYPTTLGSGANLSGFPGISTTVNGTVTSGRGAFQCLNGNCPQGAPLPALQYPNYKNANDICRLETALFEFAPVVCACGFSYFFSFSLQNYGNHSGDLRRPLSILHPQQRARFTATCLVLIPQFLSCALTSRG